ncbi:hypothetical protein D2T29_15010 [Sinirhodobacter populi]|uniref:Uncharacterized protein n=1 Tax=Paenirhodobacter populi TaxID=2306993 RepID=A0A443K8X3_9RHOB|nr:hypothetical protein [Sinirhodobacter populi]RWR29195.1 hypothetical protein D2T29_15010 [Sinirhodobacter populi]
MTDPDVSPGQSHESRRAALFRILPGQLPPAGGTLRVTDGGEHPFSVIVPRVFIDHLTAGRANADSLFQGEFRECQELHGGILRKRVFLTGAVAVTGVAGGVR